MSGAAAIPRLELDEMKPELAAYLRPRVARLNYLGEMFKCAAIDSRGRECQDEFRALEALVSPGEAIAIVMLVGRYLTHALLVNTLELTPPVPSIFEDGFTGDDAPAKDAR